MLIIYHQTTFHNPSTNCLLVSTVKLKLNDNFARSPYCYITFNENKNTLTKVAYFSKSCYHTSLAGLYTEMRVSPIS